MTKVIRRQEKEGCLGDFVKDLEKRGISVINVVVIEYTFEKAQSAGIYSTPQIQKASKALIIAQ